VTDVDDDDREQTGDEPRKDDARLTDDSSDPDVVVDNKVSTNTDKSTTKSGDTDDSSIGSTENTSTNSHWIVSTLTPIGIFLATLLDRAGVIDQTRLRATVDLAWPRIITGFAIMSKRTVDLAIVGIAVGTDAVAGLTIANAFWMVAKFIFIGLAGGTLSLVSQNYGGDRTDRATTVVYISFILSIGIGIIVVPAFVLAATDLVALVEENPAVVSLGAAYLAVVAPGLFFEGINMIGSRTYAGVGDTVTPMLFRATGAVLNIILSIVLVFGTGLGVVGAALGTTIATAVVAIAFGWGLTGRNDDSWTACPISIDHTATLELDLTREVIEVSAPLIARRVAQGIVVFPLLAIASTFGPVTVAAVGVARQIRELLNSFTWGFSIASSTLVGQALGGGNESLATDYGREITLLSFIIYLGATSIVVAFARPIASVFVGVDAVALTATFVSVAALSAIATGIDGSVTGVLRGAGDTRVPFLTTLTGLYVVALPIAWAGTVTSLGSTALLGALLAEKVVPMILNGARFNTGTWKRVSRSYRPGPDPSD
jgi:putative efflux protein, MATE family